MYNAVGVEFRVCHSSAGDFPVAVCCLVLYLKTKSLGGSSQKTEGRLAVFNAVLTPFIRISMVLGPGVLLRLV